MSGRFREMIKRKMPGSMRAAVHAARSVVGQPPIDDVVLAQYRFEPCADARPRLNFVIDNLTAASMFGGVKTGIDIVVNLAWKLDRHAPELRLILTNPNSASDAELFLQQAARIGIDPATITVVKVTSRDQAIAVRARDLFITYNWWTTLNIAPLLQTQADHFGQAIKPLIYLIQEYEPHMMPFSSGLNLAREAYDTPQRLWGVFNSSNLYDYFRLQGHQAEREFTFEPVVNARLRPYLRNVAESARERRILVYGRPGIPRNCFPALLRGLRRWAVDYPESAQWDVVSAGTAHKDYPLGNGRSLRSVGKLSLDDYAGMLLGSSVGVSLMSSPHPSYPPLEMAHFGLRTITNSFMCKALEGYHPDLVALSSIQEHALSAAIAQACERHGEPRERSPNADYVREEAYPFLADLAHGIAQEWN